MDSCEANWPSAANNYMMKSSCPRQLTRPWILKASAFDDLERIQLREEAKEMFYHAYHSYISTYPADEVLPISCRGRFREIDSNDIDESIGNFSLTLVDSLDTLVMIGDIDEFETALKRIIRDLNFDTDIVVSVFETNIRMLGGLLSAHILAKSIQDPNDKKIRYLNASTRHQLNWYHSQILDLAEDLGRRLLPAFETRTGIPYSRVNLRHGIESNGLRLVQETCTACAGSLILEFATLSRLTGDEIFEKKARLALDSIWRHRHRSTDLVGTVLNVDSGEWVRRESGVGAGSDSYYEYLLKAYILLGDSTYLHRFNRHYSSVMRYISRGPFLIDVHMHRPNRIAKGFMDALSAFWPGLQVLKGDLQSAMATHDMFNEVIKRHSYLPEAFTTDLQVYWANHQMRPEFVESTFFLHRATKEDYYLNIGRDILRKLQDLKVECGFAGLKDVRTGVHDDKMPSFVLAETLKYLYLLFSKENETYIDLEKFIFSTEGHPLPLELSLLGPNVSNHEADFEDEDSLRELSLQHEFISTLGLSKFSDKQVESIDIARLLMRISDKFNQGDMRKHVSNYEISCPSLEAQEMRFDRHFHPFLNQIIGSHLSTSQKVIGSSQPKLVEKVRDFASNDPEFKRLAPIVGLTMTVDPNGVVKLSIGNSRPKELSKRIESDLWRGNEQCMIM